MTLGSVRHVVPTLLGLALAVMFTTVTIAQAFTVRAFGRRHVSALLGAATAATGGVGLAMSGLFDGELWLVIVVTSAAIVVCGVALLVAAGRLTRK